MTTRKSQHGFSYKDVYQRMPPPTDQAERVVYVKQAGNGFAVAGLTSGIVGVVFGLGMAITFPVAIAAGLLAVVFGILGRHRAKKEPAAGRKTMATWAVVLGIIAVGLGGVGASMVNNAVNDLNRSLNQTTQTTPFDASQYENTDQCLTAAAKIPDMQRSINADRACWAQLGK